MQNYSIAFYWHLDYGDDNIKKEKEPKNSEEKRKNIKSLIEKIPTDKASLFAHPVEWSLVDNVNMYFFERFRWT